MITAVEMDRDFELDGVPSSGAHHVRKSDRRVWGTWVEQIIGAFTSNGGLIYASKVLLDSDLDKDANRMAWVLGDPVTGNNGIYRKIGPSGTGSWARSSDLPFSFIIASDEGSGTSNAIEATSNLPISSSALVLLNIFETTGPGPVTVRFNGTGPVYTIKTASGNDPATGGLLAGMQVMGRVSGETFRLYSDQASAAVLAAAEAAVLEAQGHAEDAQAAAAISTGAMSTLLDPLFATRAVAMAWTPVAAPDYIRTAGYAAAGDGGGALYKKVGSQPSHAGKFSITLSDAVTIVWFEIAEQVLTERMFGAPCDGDWSGGGTDALTQLQAWASCPVSNRKRFTGVSKATDAITFPIDTTLEGDGYDVGIDFSAAVSITGFNCVVFDGSANLVQLTDLSANVAKGATALSLVDASGIEPGDYFCIYNPADYSWMAGNVTGARNTYRSGEWCRAQSKSGNTVVLMGPLWSAYTAAAMDVYRLRGGGPRLRDFRIKPPYLAVTAVYIDCAIEPVVERIRTDGSSYAGLSLKRCINEHVDCVLFQKVESGTPGNEYGIVHSSCYGGEIHGSYYAQRHGIAFGNSDFPCCVPNRSVRVYADTYNSFGIGSLDFGHGCNENLHAIGGTHSGIAIGGKNHKFSGVRSRAGIAQGGGSSGITVSGSEFAGGSFEFDNCYFEQRSSAPSNSAVQIVPQASPVSDLRFTFKNCTFETDAADAWVIRIQGSSCPVGISLEIENPTILGGAGLTQFARLQNVGGTFLMPLLVCRGVKGLGAAVPRVVTTGGVTISEAHMDPQEGTQGVTPASTAVSSQAQAVSFSWAYPLGVTPKVKVQQFNASIGAKRCIVIGTSITNAGFTATALTCDAANFGTTAAGSIQYEATVD
ncbi:MAG: hypothetical protein QE284_00595 [Rhizobium sp.]|nr:hypothetical protein [Rhizobium sp.]